MQQSKTIDINKQKKKKLFILLIEIYKEHVEEEINLINIQTAA